MANLKQEATVKLKTHSPPLQLPLKLQYYNINMDNENEYSSILQALLKRYIDNKTYAA